MTLHLIHPSGLEVVFKEVRHYTSPCNLDKFLKTWQAPAEKSVFPYQKYSSIEELEQSTEFPPIEDFYSDLKQVDSHNICIKYELCILVNLWSRILRKGESSLRIQKGASRLRPEKDA